VKRLETFLLEISFRKMKKMGKKKETKSGKMEPVYSRF